MGDVYKGLTIQIGADVSKLTAALKGVNNAAKNTQSALKRMNNALEADPSNIAFISSKMASLSEKAAATAVKMRLLGQQVKQMHGTEIERIANNTKNLELRAASASDEYARLDRQIAELRTNAVKAFKMPSNWAKDLNKYKGLVDEALIKQAENGSAEARKMVAQLRKLQKSLEIVTVEMDKVGKAQSFKRAKEDIKLTASELKVLMREATEARNQMLAVGNTNGLRKVNAQLEKTDELAEQVKDEFKVLNEALSLNPSSLKIAASRMLNLREQVDIAKERITQLKAKMAELEAAGGKKTNRGIRELAEATLTARGRMESLTAQIQGLEGKLGQANQEAKEFSKKFMFDEMRTANATAKDLRKQIKQLKIELNEAENAYDAAKTNQNLREVQNEIKRTQAQIKNLSSMAKGASGSMSGAFFALRTAGYSLSGTVGAAVSTVAYSLVDKAETIDSAFRDMKKTVQGTDEQFDSLRKNAIEYSKTHVTSADTILEIEAMAGQLGIATDDLETFATTVSNLDISTDMEADDIAIDLGKLSSVLGDLDTNNVDKFADALVRLGNNNAALESDIMNITTRFGSMGSQVGMTSDEILAWATAASSTGVKAESAGSNMLKTLGNINSAVSKGGNKLEAWSKVIGMSADEIKKKWGDSDGGASDVFKSFITTLSKMEKTDVDATLQDLGITSVRQRQLIEGLTQSIGTMDDKLQMSKDAWNGISDQWGDAGDAANEAEQKSEGFSGAMGKLRNNLAAIADAVGTDLVPYIEMATSALQQLSDLYNSLDSGQKDALFKIAAGLTALGPGLTMVGALGSTFTMLQKGAGKALTVVGNIGARIKSLGDKLNPVTSAVTGTSNAFSSATGGISSYAYAGQKAVKASKDMGKSGQAAAKGAKTAGSSASAAAKSVGKLSSVGSKVGKALQTIGGSFNWWMLGIAAVALACQTLWETWEETKERADTFNEALTGTEETLLSWGKDVSKATDGVIGSGNTVKSINEIRDANYELAKSMVSHNEEAKSMMSEAKANIAMLESYGETVDKVSKKVQNGKIKSKSDLSSKQLGELKSALNGINELTGKNYTIKDIIQKGDVDKAKQINDELQKTIKLKELSAQADVYTSLYGDAFKEQITAQENYNAALEAYNKAKKEYDEAPEVFDPNSQQMIKDQEKAYQYRQAKKNLEEAESTLNQATGNANKYKSAMDAVNTATEKGVNSLYTLVTQNSQAFATLTANGQMTGFMSALDQLGVKYKNLTDDQKENTNWLSTLASSYDGTTASLISTLNSLGIKYSETKAKAVEYKSAISEALTSASAGDTGLTTNLASSFGNIDTFIQKVQDAGFKLEDLQNLKPVNWQSILNTSDLGSASAGISSTIKNNISSELSKIGSSANADTPTSTVTPTVDTSQASSAIAKLKTEANGLNNVKAKITPTADISSANSELSSLDSYANSVCRDRTMNISVSWSVGNRPSLGGGSASSSGTSGGASGGTSTVASLSEPSTRAVYDGGTSGFSTMAMDAASAIDALDDDFGVSAQGIYDSVNSAVSSMSALSLGLGDTVKSMSRKLGSGVNVNMQGDNGEVADLLRSIAKNTKGGQGIYLDGNKLVGGTADAYDRKMAQRERLSARGVSI